MPRPFCLVDCSNFYVSCERLFRPDLDRVPVAVLSNNDGCVVARSEEVKRLGVKMAVPFFKARETLEAAGAAIFSSNYELYADISRRVMDTLRTFAPEIETYSLDEAFFEVSGVDDLDAFAHDVRRRVLRWTGIPVRVAIAPTKTLAKIGSEHAKTLRDRGLEPALSLCHWSQSALDALLAATPIRDVWGVGRAYGARLPDAGIRTALALARADDTKIRSLMRVTGLRTAFELRGVPCIPLEIAPPTRKSLVRSRSFSRPVTDVRELREAVATHAARVCEKLRAEGLAARAVQIFFHTGHAGARGPHRSVAQAVALPRATNATPEMLRAVRRLVDALWERADHRGRPYPYRKAGVLVLDLTRTRPAQGHLFLPTRPEDDARAAALMDALDAVNRQFGKRTVTFAAEGTAQHDTETGQDWAMRRALKSPAYTTRWDDLPVFHAR